MADNEEFFIDDTKTDDVQTEPEKIKLGDKEFTQDELLEKVGLADKVSELEGKYNTKLDSVWPEYGRSQGKVKELEARLAEAEKQKETKGEIDPSTREEAIKQAKALGLLTKDDEVITKTQFREMYMAERETDKLLDELDGLEGDLDGKDGRPKFDKIKVLEHMRETGFKNPMKAYKDMNEGQLDEWKAQQLGKSKGQGMYTTQSSTSGSKQPQRVAITKDNLDALVAEALQGE